MLTFLDIDDCISNACNENANCKDGINSHTCECKEGFTGDGITCTGNLHKKFKLSLNVKNIFQISVFHPTMNSLLYRYFKFFNNLGEKFYISKRTIQLAWQ